MSKKEKPIQEIDVESLDAELAAAKKIEESKNTLFGKIAAIVAFAMSVYQIYIVFGHLAVIPMRAIHVALAFTILILAMPLYEHVFKDKFAKNQAFRICCRIIDMVMIVALWWAVYLACYEYAHLSDNNGKAGTMAVVAGAIFLVIVIDGARRCLGWIMPILAIIFLLYARFGGYIQGSLGHRGYSWDNLMKYLAVDLDGIFGTTISVSTTVIFMFVMFGAFLDISGCSNFINDLALSVTGKLRCGPALAAVVASALMGCINGSAVANVVGTGTFTIPLMKSRGYRSEFASGVEAVASTGGQILPPVMGSGAFLMVVFTAEKYTTIVKAAVIPAILYFLGAGIAVFAQGEVGNVELLPKDQIPKTKKVMADGWLYLVIIAVLVIALLVIQLSPQLSATIACASVPLVMLFDKKKRYNQGVLQRSVHRGRLRLRRRRGGHGHPHRAWRKIRQCHDQCRRRKPVPVTGLYGDGLHYSWHGPSDHLGVCYRRLRSGSGASSSESAFADSTPVRILLRLSVGHYAACCSGCLCRRRHCEMRSHEDSGKRLQDRLCRLHRALRVLLQQRHESGWLSQRDPARCVLLSGRLYRHVLRHAAMVFQRSD